MHVYPNIHMLHVHVKIAFSNINSIEIMPAVDQTKHTVQNLPTYIIKIPMCIFEPVIPLPIKLISNSNQASRFKLINLGSLNYLFSLHVGQQSKYLLEFIFTYSMYKSIRIFFWGGVKGINCINKNVCFIWFSYYHDCN